MSAAYPNALRIARTSAARVVTYGLAGGSGHEPGADTSHGTWSTARQECASRCSSAVARSESRPCRAAAPTMSRTRWASWRATRALGLEFDEIAQGLASFAGSAAAAGGERRAAWSSIDDFAHHPTAVLATIAAIRSPVPRPAAMGGRSSPARTRAAGVSTRTSTCEALRRRDLRRADRCRSPTTWCPADERLDADRVVADLRARGVDASRRGRRRPTGPRRGRRRPAGDVVLVMSNGAFGGFIDRLLTALSPPR